MNQRILMIACSQKAYETMLRASKKMKIIDSFENASIDCKVKCKALKEIVNGVASKELESVAYLEESISDFLQEHFSEYDALVFFSATGIAVRSIAPFIDHKFKDPAVLVVDELGTYCISLLSGHAGGANEMAEALADILGAKAIITTATDVEHRFSVDDFARKNQMTICDYDMAKQISAAVLDGKKIICRSALPVKNVCDMDEQLIFQDVSEKKTENKNVVQEQISYIDLTKMEQTMLGFFLGGQKQFEEKNKITGDTKDNIQWLQLFPKQIVVGIGCRKNTDKANIENAISKALQEHEISEAELLAVTSIDLKKDEAGIVDYCKEHKISFVTYSAEALNDLQGDFSKSEFVKQITGVSNVCERSATLFAEEYNEQYLTHLVKACTQDKKDYEYICKKTVYDGVTICLFKINRSIEF